jgi:hypothetical protein
VSQSIVEPSSRFWRNFKFTAGGFAALVLIIFFASVYRHNTYGPRLSIDDGGVFDEFLLKWYYGHPDRPESDATGLLFPDHFDSITYRFKKRSWLIFEDYYRINLEFGADGNDVKRLGFHFSWLSSGCLGVKITSLVTRVCDDGKKDKDSLSPCICVDIHIKHIEQGMLWDVPSERNVRFIVHGSGDATVGDDTDGKPLPMVLTSMTEAGN